MKKTQSKALVALLTAGAVTFGPVGIHAAQEPQDPQPAPDLQWTEQAQEAQVAEGRLIEVDPDARTLTLEAADGARMDFTYSTETEVTGTEADVAGLAPMAGSNVTVHFQVAEDTEKKTATRIEIEAQ